MAQLFSLGDFAHDYAVHTSRAEVDRQGLWRKGEATAVTEKAEPPPTRDVNRDSGTDSANGGWLRRLVRRQNAHFLNALLKSAMLIAVIIRMPATEPKIRLGVNGASLWESVLIILGMYANAQSAAKTPNMILMIFILV